MIFQPVISLAIQYIKKHATDKGFDLEVAREIVSRLRQLIGSHRLQIWSDS